MNPIVVGGGLAGLAAAAALATRGIRVTLLESRPRLGGRASSFTDQVTGTTIDNCQHVSLGCCTNWQHFCDTTGLTPHLGWERTLYFIARDGKVNRLHAAPFPAPLHLLPGFARLSYLSWSDKQSLARGLKALARTTPAADDPRSFADWLKENGQPPATIERFWHVVLVSALSESLDRIDVASARKVFVDAFLANRRGWLMQLPRVPLDELYSGQVKPWLEERGAEARLQAGVSRILCEGNRVRGVALRSGEELPAEEVILAVPHYLVRSLLPDEAAPMLHLDRLDQIETAPISSVHLWFDRPITDLPHAVLIDRLSQWLFNRGTVRESGNGPRSYYQVVISASHSLRGRPQQEVVEEVVRELREIFPEARAARLEHGRFVTEHRAVFSVRPGTRRFRLPQRTAVSGLYLAGDWTQTGWPGTMESAVRSGYLAAEALLADKGRPDPILQPDLPKATLARLLMGI